MVDRCLSVATAAPAQTYAIAAHFRFSAHSAHSTLALVALDRKLPSLRLLLSIAPPKAPADFPVDAVKERSIMTAAATVSSTEASTSVDTATLPLTQKFVDLRQRGKVALIPYITAGDPDLETTEEALKALEDCGADIIELGVPYSDPLADGPVIQAAATRALKRGTTLASVLGVLKRVTPTLNCPIVLFTYYNMILKHGVDNFTRALKEAGVSGIVVPDIPLEETHHLRQFTSLNGIELVLLTTPTTPSVRVEAIAQASQGFVYLVSLTGVTGARALVNSKVETLLKELKKATSKPVAVGFGISKPEHGAQVAKWGADGVIVGSAVVKILSEGASPEEAIASMKRFISDLRAALP